MGENLVSARKRARTEEAYSTTVTSGNCSHDERVKQILNRLSDLYNEYPELKFMIDFENLKAISESAVVKYAEDIETKMHKAETLIHYGQEKVPLYCLPDEVLSNCLSFVGKGHYGVVGLASIKETK